MKGNSLAMTCGSHLAAAAAIFFAVTLGATFWATAVFATQYWTEEDYLRSLAEEPPVVSTDQPFPMPSVTRYDYSAEFIHTANFLGTLQVSDSLDPEFGGEMEGEHLPDVVQSDNTSEVIWVWSRLSEEHGVDSLLYRVADAWTYISHFPAYLEEGSTSPDSGYYRVYNCGWALRAEMEYRCATGDVSLRTYADSCADYLVANPLNLHVGAPSGFYSRVNGLVESWAMGNLYEYGQDIGNPLYMSTAAATAESIRTWVEADSTRLKLTVWAMSGGAAMWGLVHSYFAAHPDEAVAWVTRYAPNLSYTVGGGQYANAWNGWFTLGHWAAYEVTWDPLQLGMHQGMTDSLLSRDGDHDGGIPVRYVDYDTQDQSWVSSYMAFMGLDKRHVLLASVDPRELAARSSGPVAVARPNPFAASTTIQFSLDRGGTVSLEVFDLAGRRVDRWGPSVMGAGSHGIPWTGLDAGGRRLATGLYFYRLSTPQGAAKGKLLLSR